MPMSGSAGPFNAAALNAEQLGVILLRELTKQPSAIDGLKVAAVLDRFKALGAPPQDLKDDLGDTPVLLAMKRRHFDFGERMIDEGWDVTARNQLRMSAGVYAAAWDRRDLTIKMQEKGLQQRELDINRKTLLRDAQAMAEAGMDPSMHLTFGLESINEREDAAAAEAASGMRIIHRRGVDPTN